MRVDGYMFAPRLFLEDPTIPGTPAGEAEARHQRSGRRSRLYVEALGRRIDSRGRTPQSHISRADATVANGLVRAAWPAGSSGSDAYIEEHLSEHIPLAPRLPGSIEPIPYFAAHSSNHSGAPPHRYHTNRRIERRR